MTTCCWRISTTWPSRSTTSTHWTFGGEWLFGVSKLPRNGRERRLLSANRDIGLSRLRQRQRDARSHRTSSCASCRSPRRFVSCPPAAARRSSPTLAAASGSSTGATAKRASSSTFLTTRSSSVGPTVQGRRHRRRAGDRGGSALPDGRCVFGRASSTSGRKPTGIRTPPRASSSATRSTSAGTRSASRSTSGSEAASLGPTICTGRRPSAR